ncbi:guanylate kinase [Blochmannia endosymbiont of Camponotus sp. C-046]|uniref:guanylate kinase n=1 Tax=Blochmannia endosymbiont of Camponotus sp. C-046 TaxID=2945589 RepID=UPI0020248AB2|nr:guanylate kinase [Blochmannia endosymbiont of Camponotus sp. C-046]URJ28708.1 guanylate kinase [Blochmannia endosymbiont of Camponotus sp. C-046]
MTKNSGILCIISAPSGAGKSTLIQTVMQYNRFIYQTKLSISYTTRIQRPGEIHGKDYYFVSKKMFKYMIDRNMFFEYAKIFNYYYGTAKSNIEMMLNTGVHIILNIDWKGAQQIRNKISKNIYTIFILPPSKKELAHRLYLRGQDTKKVIAIRMKQAMDEISHFKEYDYVVVNDNFDVALIHLQSIMLSEQLRIAHQEIRYATLINNLLLPDM